MGINKIYKNVDHKSFTNIIKESERKISTTLSDEPSYLHLLIRYVEKNFKSYNEFVLSLACCLMRKHRENTCPILRNEDIKTSIIANNFRSEDLYLLFTRTAFHIFLF